MKRTKEELAEAFRIDDFPRSATYDPEWVIENMMGPNVLWLTEALSQVMDLQAWDACAGYGLRPGNQLYLPGKGVRCAGLGNRPVDQTYQ